MRKSKTVKAMRGLASLLVWPLVLAWPAAAVVGAEDVSVAAVAVTPQVVTDPCKVAAVPGSSLAVLMHAGAGVVDTPKDHPVTAPVPIVPPADCRGGLVDVVIFPEGYTAADLARFDNDAALWLREFMSLSPYKEYRDAFNVWRVRLASRRRIAVGSSDTVFGMSLTSSGTLSSSASRMSRALFDGLRHVPYNRVHRSGSRLKQLVTAILVMRNNCTSTTSSCSGYSGFTRSFTDPVDSRVSVRGAVSRGHMHELGHAFGLMSDEYQADSPRDCSDPENFDRYNPSNYSITNIGNHSYSNRAVDVPWRHLLFGNGLNTAPGFIGAYEGAKTCWTGAWRPEYRCLMNGTHGNRDSCHPNGGATLRQTSFCNWCREMVVMRLFDDVGFLARTNTFQDWITNYRMNYWAQYPVKLPDRGLPIKDTCGAPVEHEDAF